MNQLSEKIESVFPLSPTQAGMLYHTISSPGSATYIGQHRIRLRDVDSTALRKAWQLVVDRHSALRTAYVWEGLSQSVQLVHAQFAVEIDETQFSGSEEQLSAFCEAERHTEFQFDKLPPARIKLLHLSDTESELLWTRHHLMVDGWSAHAVLRDLADAYTAAIQNTPWQPPAVEGFASYVAWLQQQDITGSQRYWQSLLGTSRSMVDLEGLRSSSRGVHQTEQIDCVLSDEFSRELRNCCRQVGVTLSALMHAAWSAVIAGVNADSRLVFGSTVSGRPTQLRNADSIVGNFINTLPVVVDTQANESLTDFLKSLQLQIATSSEHSHIPHRDVVSAAALEPGTPLFESIVVFMNYPKLEESQSELHIAQHHYKEHSHYPVAVLIVPDELIKIILIHDTGVIEAFKAQALVCSLQKNLRSLINSLELSTQHFFSQARAHTSTLSTTELSVIPENVLSLLRQSIDKQPHAIALNDGTRSLSYAELGNAAGNLANALRDCGVKTGDRVLIRMPRTIEGLVAIWGVLYAGATYVPCKPNESAVRLIDLQTATEARCVITSELLTEVSNALVFDRVDTTECVIEPAVQSMDSLAYIIFTSGSTGDAKQVPVSHGNLAHSLAARLQYYEKSPKVYGLLSPLAFDSSVAGIFWMAAAVGELLLISEAEVLEPETLVNKLLVHKADAMLCLPSVYSAVLAAWPQSSEHSLQLLIVAGEACPSAILSEHQSTFPEATLVNEYGPTEASVWCTAQRFNPGDSSKISSDYLPIGYAIPGVTLSVQNEHGVVPSGAIGQLTVSGPTVVASVMESGSHYPTGDLVEQNQDGALLFHGRIDQQVKIRGHRVDPADIEASLSKHQSIEDCAVFAVPQHSDVSLDDLDKALSQLSAVEANELLHIVENYNAPT